MHKKLLLIIVLGLSTLTSDFLASDKVSVALEGIERADLKSIELLFQEKSSFTKEEISMLKDTLEKEYRAHCDLFQKIAWQTTNPAVAKILGYTFGTTLGGFALGWLIAIKHPGYVAFAVAVSATAVLGNSLYELTAALCELYIHGIEANEDLSVKLTRERIANLLSIKQLLQEADSIQNS
jgi:hypothetical protein